MDHEWPHGHWTLDVSNPNPDTEVHFAIFNPSNSLEPYSAVSGLRYVRRIHGVSFTARSPSEMKQNNLICGQQCKTSSKRIFHAQNLSYHASKSLIWRLCWLDFKLIQKVKGAKSTAHQIFQNIFGENVYEMGIVGDLTKFAPLTETHASTSKPVYIRG